MGSAILTRDLSFGFSKHRPILHRISLDVPEGSIYGFLGPNGAGKTTTMRLLTGLLATEKDQIFLLGESLKTARPGVFSKLGALIETPSFYLHLTARENLRLICKMRQLPESRIDHVLKLVRLDHTGKKTARQFSLGMKQRLAIAIALLPDPQLLMLDEPVNGLDPNGIIEIRELLVELNKTQGKTIFISSHLLQEVERMCTHIGIIHHGRLEFQGSMQELKAAASSDSEVRFTVMLGYESLASVQEHWPEAKITGHQVVFPFMEEMQVAALNKALVDFRVPITGIQIKGGLEDWFMQIIQSKKVKSKPYAGVTN